MIMFLIIVNYGKLWQTFGEGHRDPCQYLANTVMMITWKTFHIQLRLTTCQTLHWLHTTWEQEGIGSLKTSENNLVTQLYVKLETKFREDFTITLFSTRAFSWLKESLCLVWFCWAYFWTLDFRLLLFPIKQAIVSGGEMILTDWRL